QSANAACQQYALPGQFTITQGNGPVVTLYPQVKSVNGTQTNFGGFAMYNQVAGQMDGFLAGTRFHLTVTWNNGDRGIYTAVVGDTASGTKLVDGRTYNAVHPANWSVWSSNTNIQCAPSQAYLRYLQRRGH